ncbi:MOSC domain-containing protein [Candidatus Binatia bacterium]|nr:MOSC domain-containing protein [Candidatus Binatia bacterium]
MHVDALYRFPVKGLAGEPLDAVDLAPGTGVPHDRRFAVLRGDTAFDAASPRWVAKEKCVMLMRDAALARIALRYDPVTLGLALQAPGEPPLETSLATDEGRALAAAYVARVADPPGGPPRIVEAGAMSFTDVPENCLSIVGRASIDALSAAAGHPLHPLRFRANVYLTGIGAFEELGWLGREVAIGGVVVRPFARIPRCAATSVNPATAERDVTVPKGLKQHFGHVDMGVYAEVVRGGRIATGDAAAPPVDTRPGSDAWLPSLLRTARLYLRQGLVLARRR